MDKDCQHPPESDNLLCKTCLDSKKAVVFELCGHFCSCTNCVQSIGTCPICRAKIVRQIKTFIV